MDLTIFSIIVSSIISFLIGRYFVNRKKKVHEKIEEIKANAEYLEKIRTKHIELIRHAFSKIFLILLLMSIAFFVPIFFDFVGYNQNVEISQPIVNWIQFLVMLACVSVSYWAFRTFHDVVNYESAMQKHKDKIAKLSKKIEYT